MSAVRQGPQWELENQATALLMRDRKQRGIKGIAAQAEEYSWLSEHQLINRQEHEVYTTVGSPDPNIVEGRTFRAYNPLFGKRPRRSETVDW